MDLNRCPSRMRIACSLLSLLRKSLRSADSKASKPSAVTSLFIPLSCAAWSSTPRRNSTPLTCASRNTSRTYSTPKKSSSKLVARLLLATIIPSASAEIFAVRPMAWYSSGSASEIGSSRKGAPSAALINRFRTWSEWSSRTRPWSAARKIARSTATLIVLAPWNQRSPRSEKRKPISRSCSATAVARALLAPVNLSNSLPKLLEPSTHDI